MADLGRDRLRELLDAVLTEEGGRLPDLASAANASPFHFARQVSDAAGEAPMALRRRVLLERAAWRLQRGAAVTETAFEAGYESVEGFTRAFTRAYGCAPSRLPAAGDRGHWLPAPNGLHFHSPTVLYVDGTSGRTHHEHDTGDVVALLVRHDMADTDALLEAASAASDDAYRRSRLPGHEVLAWAGAEESLADVCRHLAIDKLPWIASLEGADAPDLSGPDDPATLRGRHHEVGARWLALVRDVERRGAWQDRVIDALCDPPESFVIAQIVAHVVTFSAHRRQLARWMLRQAGVDLAPTLDPDPITWQRQQYGGTP